MEKTSRRVQEIIDKLDTHTLDSLYEYAEYKGEDIDVVILEYAKLKGL